MGKTLGELADLVGGCLEGDPARTVQGVAGLQEAGHGDVAFVAIPRFKTLASATKAGCLIVPLKWRKGPPDAALIRVVDPNRAMALVAAVLCEPLPVPKPGVHPNAVVAPSAVLGRGVHVGACAVVGEKVRIGDRTRLRAGAIVADGAVVGADCDIYPNVVIRERVRLGGRGRPGEDTATGYGRDRRRRRTGRLRDGGPGPVRRDADRTEGEG